AEHRLPTADNEHGDIGNRVVEGETVGRQEADVMHHRRTGSTRDAAAEREGDDLIVTDVDAAGFGKSYVLRDRTERPAVLRPHQGPDESQDNDESDKRKIVEPQPRRERKA